MTLRLAYVVRYFPPYFVVFGTMGTVFRSILLLFTSGIYSSYRLSNCCLFYVLHPLALRYLCKFLFC